MSRDTAVVLLASAEFPELEPLTHVLPAAMLPVLNEPLLEGAVRRAVDAGLTDIRICVCSLAHVIETYFDEGQRWGASIRYSVEPLPLASVASMRRIRHTLPRTALVLSPLGVHDIDLAGALAAHRSSGARLTRISHEGRTAGWVVETDLLQEAAEGELADVEERLKASGHPVAQWRHEGHWWPTDTLAGWHEVNMRLCREKGRADASALGAPGGRGKEDSPAASVWMGKGTRLGPGVELRGCVVLGDNVSVGQGTRLENCIVFNHTALGEELDVIGKVAAGPMIVDVAEEFGVWMASPKFSMIRSQQPWLLLAARRLVRSGERLLAIVALILLSPLLLSIALVVKLTSRGPVLYMARRVCAPEIRDMSPRFLRYRPRRETVFPVFRTMVADADSQRALLLRKNMYGTGPFRKAMDDPRIVPFGRFLRRTSLDELPLLLGVAFGSLRMIGLWALPEDEADHLARGAWGKPDMDGVAALRFAGEPGLAGVWQSHGRRTLSSEERAVYDAYQAMLISRRETALDFFGRSHLPPPVVWRKKAGLMLTTLLSVIRRHGAH